MGGKHPPIVLRRPTLLERLQYITGRFYHHAVLEGLQQPAPGTGRVVGRLARAQVEQSLRRAARRVGWRSPHYVATHDVGFPDTAVALESAALMRSHSPGALAAHCYRTYLFGAVLGTRDGLDWDAELLFVSAMLHDLGLTKFPGGRGPFEQRGAEAAESWLHERGWPQERAGVVARAIRMHLDVGAAGRERPEVALLHFGAAADVTGMRLEDIHPRTVAEVLHDHPRSGFEGFFAGKIRGEARAEPRSTTALLCRWGQFLWRIRHSPFERDDGATEVWDDKESR